MKHNRGVGLFIFLGALLVVPGCGLVETRDDIFVSADGATIVINITGCAGE